MKKVLAWILICTMFVSLTACGKKDTADSPTDTKTETKAEEQAQKPKDPLEGKDTFTLKTEMEEEGIELEAVIGYPKNAGITVEDGSFDSYKILADKEDGYELSIYLSYDSTTYDDNQEYAKEETHYEEKVFSGFEGYAVQRFENSFEVNLYLDYLEYEDVYLYIDIRNHIDVDLDNQRDVYELYQLPEVQEILESVVYTPQGEERPDPEERGEGLVWESSDTEENNHEWWAGEWYGWWCIKDGSGEYEQFNDIAWDAYAVIEDYGNSLGSITLWDSETERDNPLAICAVMFDVGLGEHGSMYSDGGAFFVSDMWLPRVVTVMPMEIEPLEWMIDPADTSVSHFTDMIEITGTYIDPTNSNNYMDYYIYLRPWGTVWEDVRSGDTSGCIYNDMMPVHYDDWYIPLMAQDVRELPASRQEGEAMLAGGFGTAGVLDPAGKEGADGKVDLATLEKLLPWCKTETSYDTSYEEVAAQFGVHGKQIESLFENNTIYRWLVDDENYIQITFDIHEDGSETWNVTQWEGID